MGYRTESIEVDHSTVASEEIRETIAALHQGNCGAISNSWGVQLGTDDRNYFQVTLDSPPTISKQAVVQHLNSLSKSGAVDIRLHSDALMTILQDSPPVRNLSIFRSSDNDQFDSTALQDLRSVRAEAVFINLGPLVPDAFSGIGAIGGMKTLALEETSIMPDGWSAITSSPTLEKLEFRRCTFQRVEQFQALSRAIEVEFINCDDVSEEMQERISGLATK